MGEDDYRQALLEKLVEEAQEAAQEVAQACEGELVKEIADILEVIEAVLDVWDISKDEVMEMKQERYIERGGFEKRLRLISTE